MNNLWVYGCSYSYAFAHINSTTKSNAAADSNLCWGYHLAEHFNLNYKNRALAGIGWARIKSFIESDFNKWDKKDLIIISPSLFGRVDPIEFSVNNVKSPKYYEDFDKWILYTDYHYIYTFTEDNWYNYIKFLFKQGYNVYSWPYNQTKYKSKRIINPPDNFKSWEDWNLKTPEYWVKTEQPYVHTARGDKDTHFSTVGHKYVFEHMLGSIKYDF